MTHEAHKLEPIKRKRTFASNPAFYLIYLLFYFGPWLFKGPQTKDIIAVILAIAVFLPIYYVAFNKTTPKYISAIIAMQAIGFIVAPFNGMHGVFHIYASVQAGYQRPAKRAGIILLLLTLSYLALSYFYTSNWFEVVMVLFVGAVTGIGCMANAEELEHREYLERTSVLDKQRATLAERERIAADLHDLLGHTLTMVALKAEVADKFLDKDIGRARREIREIRNEARAALGDVRQAVSGMNTATIKTEVERAKIALQAAGIELDILGDLPNLDDQQDKTLGLAIREAVTNIVRHSKAKNAELSFVQSQEGIVISIKDNGVGGSCLLGAGLTGLKRRIENLEGRVDIDMHNGTHIKLFMRGRNS